ncbi:MAG: transglutaminase domain-containing protein [Ferruginibacter sp.]
MSTRLLIILLLCIIALQLPAQDKSKAKFGNVTEDDFKQTVYSIDSNANAVVIADIGSTEIVGNDKGNFSLQFKKFTRIHILNKNGYDAAKIEIGIYTNEDQEEKLNSLKAVTYNLENGKITETKLDKDNVFKVKISKHLILKKFTLPNIKEGCIIEFQYEILSDFIFNLQPWEFQGNYPRLWSEYKVDIPSFYRFITLSQGYQPFFIKSNKDGSGVYTVTDLNGTQATEHTTFTTGTTLYRWVMKDVPALKEENYTSTINNHISRIEFQLSALAAPFNPKNVMASWPEAATDLLKDEDFGESLRKDNPWLNDFMPAAVNGAVNDLDKARNIFAWLRDNMTCTNHNRKYIETSLKTVLKTRNGNEAEINLLLTDMLKKAGLNADPVILSTRSHGIVYALYPLLDRFNYVITRLQVNNNDYYLDASQPGLGFGKLTNDVYNGHARVINESATP